MKTIIRFLIVEIKRPGLLSTEVLPLQVKQKHG